MGLDINYFISARKGEPNVILESQKRRGADSELVQKVVDQFDVHRKLQYDYSQMQTRMNKLEKEIYQATKAGQDSTELRSQKKEIEQNMAEQKPKIDEADRELQHLRRSVGNIVHKDVPVSDNEDNNALADQWSPEGFDPSKKSLLSHHHILGRLGGYDMKRAAKIAGHRAVLLKNVALYLNQALLLYGQQFLARRGFDVVQPPSFLRERYMAATCQLEDFEESLYGLDYKPKENEAHADLVKSYLIATSEQPISALHCDEVLIKAQLPIKYAGSSSCFRKEAGSAGRDMQGIFRVHEFQKVEQFVICSPLDGESEKLFEEMISNSKEFMQSLNLPYRVVDIVSGALNNAATKKQDLEAWYPHQQRYRELCSVSNCTSYQSRELDIKYNEGNVKPKGSASNTWEGDIKFVHMLNGTLCATQRTMTCIVENNSRIEGDMIVGVNVPQVLQPYLPNKEEFFQFPESLPVKEVAAYIKKVDASS